MTMSLWGAEFDLAPEPKKEKQKKIIDKAAKPKEVKTTTEKVIRSKSSSVSIHDKLRLIKEEVLRILGVYKDQTVVIRTREDLTKYIDAAIVNGEIAIDTETNNRIKELRTHVSKPSTEFDINDLFAKYDD